MPEAEEALTDYRDELEAKTGTGTEYTPRTPFENLLNDVKPEQDLEIIHEPMKSEDLGGHPDFKVLRSGLTIGHIETKPVGSDLDSMIQDDKSSGGDQLERYREGSANLILTDYQEFILFKQGEEVDRVKLFEGSTFEIPEGSATAFRSLLKTFFIAKPAPVEEPSELSALLAGKTKLFATLLEELVEEGEGEFVDRLIGDKGLYSLYRDTLLNDLTKDQFINTYSQTICFGLFLARLHSDEEINLEDAVSLIPEQSGILADLFGTLYVDEIPGSISWIIDEMLYVLNNTDIEKIEENLSFSSDFGDEDPYVYFYETYLAEFDPELRRKKGVFYTPIPVVRNIVDNIDLLLDLEFQETGLEDEEVTALDFAVGTGTFLLEAFERAFSKTDEGLHQNLVSEHLLENFYGFENMIAPYTVCHLKLSQYLDGEGYPISDSQRPQVFLTDTLDKAKHDPWGMFPTISEEGELANQVKVEDPILVIMGNPPYSIHSENNSPWIRGLIEDYKGGLNEKKVNLDDDYIKFLRYAQWKIEKTGRGIVGVVTNNSFLDGITHREMRRSLAETFDQIYVLNLHGNQIRGDPGENVFDIRRAGISVTFFVRTEGGSEGLADVSYRSTVQEEIFTAEDKYEFLSETSLNEGSWKSLSPCAPYFWFLPKEIDPSGEYAEGWSVEDVFRVSGSGIKTDRDPLFVDVSQDELEGRIRQLLSGGFDKDFREEYRVQDTSSYPIESRIESASFDPANLYRYHYRPFDLRFIYYQQGLTSRPAAKVMDPILDVEANKALVTVRQVAETRGYTHVFVSDLLTDHRITTSNRGHAFCYPLYLEEQETEQTVIGDPENPESEDYVVDGRAVNFTGDFVDFIQERYPETPTPEETFSYIYAVLHSPGYREKYWESLKVDYPKIQFVDDPELFGELAEKGKRLIDLHTFKDQPKTETCEIPGPGDFRIESIEYFHDDEKVEINSDQAFEEIPPEVWEFELGGYQVLERWLSERAGAELNLEQVRHFQRTARTLAESLAAMNEIDSLLNP